MMLVQNTECVECTHTHIFNILSIQNTCSIVWVSINILSKGYFLTVPYVSYIWIIHVYDIYDWIKQIASRVDQCTHKPIKCASSRTRSISHLTNQ